MPMVRLLDISLLIIGSGRVDDMSEEERGCLVCVAPRVWLSRSCMAALLQRRVDGRAAVTRQTCMRFFFFF